MEIHFFCVFLLTAKVYADVSHLGYNYERSNVDSFYRAQPIPNPTSIYNGPVNKYLPPVPVQQAPIITKQFFTVSAPEESNELPRTKHFIIGRPQKNYRVIFIKAPASEQANVRFTAELAPQEEKTVIYVLSKKPNEIEIDEVATPKANLPSKPDVFFIKYKTPEEAVAAQKEIQEQYDHLGGTTEISDEGIAPVQSVIGSLDGDNRPNKGYNYGTPQNEQKSTYKQDSRVIRYY